MKICGIDPGKKGAFAILDGDKIILRKMPDEANGIVQILSNYSRNSHVFLEKAQVMSIGGNKQGICSMFHYGDGFGQIKGILAAMKIPYTLVHPRTWTRVMHKGCTVGEPKARSLETVRRLFPQVELRRTERCRNMDEGFIDALLIAEYGRRALSGHF